MQCKMLLFDAQSTEKEQAWCKRLVFYLKFNNNTTNKNVSL